MRKSPSRAALDALHRLKMEPNTEGELDGLKWAGAPGLFVRWSNNTQSWVFRWNVRGKKRVMGLGSRREVTDHQAFDLAAKYMAIVRQGGDPRAVRDAEREAAGLKPVRSTAVSTEPTIRTFRDAARAYLAERETQWRDPNLPLQWTQRLRDYVYPIIGDVPVGEVTVDHLVEILKPIWREKHVTAGKVRSHIALMLDWAEAHKWRSGDNPARAKAVDIRLGNGFHKSVQHFKAIHYPQMPAFWKALAALDGVKADVVRFQVLTATRPSDALGAVWEEIDLEQQVWTIPPERMKMEQEHRVPLSDAAIEVLERRRAEAGDAPTGLVFPAPSGKPLYRAVPRKLVKELGYDATAHGTARSSFSDWAAEVAKADREVRELSLAHREQNEAVRAYRRSDLLEARRELMQEWADYLTTRAAS